MTHTHAVDINDTMKAGSNNHNQKNQCSTNGYIVENAVNESLENAIPFDVDQQKKYVYKMHNYCCNPEQLKKKCDENYQKLLMKRKELGSAKKKIKLLKNRVAILKDVIKNMKQNGNGTNSEHKSL